MQLRGIWYELYQADLDALESRGWGVPHEIEGQVRLEFDDAYTAYIFAVQHLDTFCADFRRESHFVTPLSHINARFPLIHSGRLSSAHPSIWRS